MFRSRSCALAADLVLDELLVLLELPPPAMASATPTRARIDDLGTGDYSCRSRSGEDGAGQRPAHSRSRAAPLTPASRDPFPANFIVGPERPTVSACWARPCGSGTVRVGLSVPCRRMPGSLSRSPSTSLRAWQSRALDRLGDWREGPFLISAAPGAGKTRPALELARDLLARGLVRRVAVLCPTTPLTRQWAAAAAILGVQLQPDAAGPNPPRDFDGVAVTYARVASDPAAWAGRYPRIRSWSSTRPTISVRTWRGARLSPGVRRGAALAAAVRHPVSLRCHTNPGRALRQRRHGCSRRLLYVCRGCRGWCLSPGGVRDVRRDPVVAQRR